MAKYGRSIPHNDLPLLPHGIEIEMIPKYSVSL